MNAITDFVDEGLKIAMQRRAERLEDTGAAALSGDIASAEDPECTDATS